MDKCKIESGPNVEDDIVVYEGKSFEVRRQNDKYGLIIVFMALNRD